MAFNPLPGTEPRYLGATVKRGYWLPAGRIVAFNADTTIRVKWFTYGHETDELRETLTLVDIAPYGEFRPAPTFCTCPPRTGAGVRNETWEHAPTCPIRHTIREGI